MKRIVTGMLVGLIALALSATVFAKTPSDKPSAPSESAVKADKEKGKEKAEKSQNKNNRNNEDKLRGLDRADEVAGEHGDQGRDKAGAKQGR
ncbi:MAG: hypothetical protein ABJB49_02110 [Nitrospirota bacterium]